MNVLLSAVGRRDYLVRWFKGALGDTGKVVATNSDPSTSGMEAADFARVLPKSTDPGYVDALLSVCQQFEVGLLCSLHDWDAPVIAASADRFEQIGVRLAVSSLEVLKICLDKFRFQDYLHTIGVRSPETFASLSDVERALEGSSLRFPLVVKPRFGQGSTGTFIISSIEELYAAHLLSSKVAVLPPFQGGSTKGELVVIQQFVSGVEYGMDVINDLNGNYRTTLARRKIQMRLGETESAETVIESFAEKIGSQIGSNLGHIGVLDLDLVIDSQGTPWVIDANPRFGGGYPFSHLAGADVPSALISWAKGRTAPSGCLAIQAGVRARKHLVPEIILSSINNR